MFAVISKIKVNILEVKNAVCYKCALCIYIKNICIPESFNTNISHQLFDYTITFVNSQHQQIQKVIWYSKAEINDLKISG